MTARRENELRERMRYRGMNRKSIQELCLQRDRALDAQEAQQVDRVVASRGEGRLYVRPDNGTHTVR